MKTLKYQLFIFVAKLLLALSYCHPCTVLEAIYIVTKTIIANIIFTSVFHFFLVLFQCYLTYHLVVSF